MFDIHFYMKAHEIIQKMLKGEKFKKSYILEQFESFRRKDPVVYNIETTNACNMLCKMCPRTTKMTRKVETIKRETFIGILSQLRPWSNDEWGTWEKFVKSEYKIEKDEQSENNFFLYIIPKVIQLHGYGDPLLDRNMAEYVKLLTDKGFYSYFSCNPANINMAATERMFENGLSFIKYSIESVDDKKHKEIRGEASNFTESYSRIKQLLDIKAKKNYKTTVIITMLDLNNTWQKEEFEKLENAFKGLDVYVYLKSEDQQWYRKDYHGTQSVHWSEICKHPWMSMTIKSNAEAAMCMEDYNNEIILGNVQEDSLYDIWNGEKYAKFRMDQIDVAKGFKCNEECDMHLVGEFLTA
jgi:MoaA/NifB/PqqE/SkfB family radical SAM enzyme